jgi:hypothetical protein
MLYGEGPRAFMRLQEHIVKEVNDMSIFAWTQSKAQTYRGIFADDVSAFSKSSSIRHDEDISFSPDFTVTNKGLHVEAVISTSAVGGDYLMKLNCAQISDDGSKKRIGVYLSQQSGGIYSRVRASEYGSVDGEDAQFQSRRIFIAKHVSAQQSADLQNTHQDAFFFRKNFNPQGSAPFHDFPFFAQSINPSQHWDARRHMFLTHGASDFTACIMFERRGETSAVGKDIFPGQWFIVVLGITDGEPRPWITVAGMNDGGPELFVAKENLRTLAALGRKRRFELTTTVDGMLLDKDGIPMDMAPVGRVSASIHEGVIDGQSVYCVDLEYQATSTLQTQKRGKKTHRFLEHSVEADERDSDFFAPDLDGWRSS